MEHPETSGTLFEAAIVPHRSLSPRGLRSLTGVICLLCGVTVVGFWFVGAWPVTGFGAIETGLAIFLLRLNARQARTSELIVLTHAVLRIVRSDRRGRRGDLALPVAWLNVVLEEPVGRVPKLVLAGHGVREEIAAALGEAEKRDLAAALRAALDRLRNPRFDNPQLRAASDL